MLGDWRIKSPYLHGGCVVMQEINDSSSTQMGNLNNAVIALIDASPCTTIEAITVLRLVTQRLDKAFEMSVMGSPVKTIADKAKETEVGSNMEKDTIR